MMKGLLTKWPFLLGVIIVLAFFVLKFVPSGHIVYERDYSQTFRSGKGFVLGFTPAERVDLSQTLPKLIGDPVYFSLFTPRTFDTAKVTIVYQDHLSSSTPLIEMGVLKDKVARSYDLQPVENKTLAALAQTWTKIGTSNLMLLENGKNYSDLKSFQADLASGALKDCPSGSSTCLATYNYAPVYNFTLPGLKTSAITLAEPLRGQHQFYVYAASSTLDLAFNFVDMNQDAGPDPITVNLYYGAKMIDSRQVADNDPVPASGVAVEKKLALVEKNLRPGVYKAEIKITDDTVIKSIQSSSDKLVFINHLWPVSASGPLDLYTDAPYLLVKAFTPASLQTLSFGGQDFNLDAPYQQYEFDAPASAAPKEIRLNRDDVILDSNSVFSWSKDSLFNPSLKKVDNHFAPDGIKYILADYQAPTEQNGWQSATRDFSLTGSDRENGKYSFLLSVPGLKTGSDDYLIIKDIKVELQGRSLWEKLKALYGNK